MDLIIRPIASADYRAAAEIWRDVLNVPTTEESLDQIYTAMGRDHRYATFVAEADGKVIGLVTTVTALAVGHPAGYTKVNGLGVLPEYRKKGVGKALLERAEQTALENGTRYLGLASGLSRTDAHMFYEHMGYQKTSYWFRKRLPPD